MKLPLCLLTSAFCILLAGCRTAGPQVCIRDSSDVRVAISDSATEAHQGKSVGTEVSPGRQIAPALQLADNVVAQGDATKTGDTGDAVQDSAPAAAKTPDTPSTPSTESTSPNTPPAEGIAEASASPGSVPAE